MSAKPKPADNFEVVTLGLRRTEAVPDRTEPQSASKGGAEARQWGPRKLARATLGYPGKTLDGLVKKGLIRTHKAPGCQTLFYLPDCRKYTPPDLSDGSRG